MSTLKVCVVGGRGYVGAELLALLEAHPNFELARVASRSLAGKSVRETYPNLTTRLHFEDLGPAAMADTGCDAIILALANGEAAEYVAHVPDSVAIVDLSADYRFDKGWTYGLPERNATALKSAHRVSNPGCYATAAQLALMPLVDVFAGTPVVFGLSGYSGAGRRPSPKNDPQRLADNVIPYSLSDHVHEREISHQMGRPVRFMPHVLPFFRGISVTVTAEITQPLTDDEVLERFTNHYARSAMTDVQLAIPEISQVANTPRAIVGGFAGSRKHVVVVSVLDNLLKGAASQAVENLNLMFGHAQATGLEPALPRRHAGAAT